MLGSGLMQIKGTIQERIHKCCLVRVLFTSQATRTWSGWVWITAKKGLPTCRGLGEGWCSWCSSGRLPTFQLWERSETSSFRLRLIWYSLRATTGLSTKNTSNSWLPSINQIGSFSLTWLSLGTWTNHWLERCSRTPTIRLFTTFFTSIRWNALFTRKLTWQ